MISTRRAAVSFILSVALGGSLHALSEGSLKTEKKVSSEKKIVGDPIVAKVGTAKVIRRSEVLEAMRSLPPAMLQQMPADKLFASTLDRLVRAYLLAEAAKKAGIEKDSAFQKALENDKADLLSRSFLMKEVQTKVSKSTLEARYKKFVAEFPKEKEHHLFHILTKEEDAAKAVIKELEKGTKFEDVAKEKSIAPSKEKSGDEGYVMKSMLPPQLQDAINKLTSGEFTKIPVKTDLGYHIFKITDSRDAVPPKYEEIEQALQSLIFQEEAIKLIKKLESQKKIERFNEDGTPAVEEEEKASAIK
ncbi:MAG: peptidyl-prolyl cis-trans isomerase [Holosporales bacterium]|nr:peptidyl-prolyl cis-trans isomerase [Holosporales bacterium]